MVTNSEILRLIAEANKKCGYTEYANFLFNQAAVKEAEETANGKGGEDNEGS